MIYTLIYAYIASLYPQKVNNYQKEVRWKLDKDLVAGSIRSTLTRMS